MIGGKVFNAVHKMHESSRHSVGVTLFGVYAFFGLELFEAFPVVRGGGSVFGRKIKWLRK
jgi:hypothetical protein